MINEDNNIVDLFLESVRSFAEWAFSTTFISWTYNGTHFEITYGMTFISLAVIGIVLDVILYGFRSTFSKGDDD